LILDALTQVAQIEYPGERAEWSVEPALSERLPEPTAKVVDKTQRELLLKVRQGC
jgi:hypothetical protein